MSNILNFIALTNRDGGATYSLVTGELNPSTGYMVSLKGRELRVPYIAHKVHEYVGKFIEQNGSELISPDRYIGSWVDGGDLFLDVSINVDDKAKAAQIAVVHQQLAFWDCSKKVVVTI